MRPTKKKWLRGIGVLGAMIGKVSKQVPFVKLGIIIYVYIFFMKEDFPSLMSNKYMITKVLYIILQGGYLDTSPLR